MIRRLITAQSAGVAVFVALCLPVVIGLGALGVEVSFWLLTQRSMQGAADAAAISASFANKSLTTMQNQAYAVAAQNGYTNGSNGVTVTVNNPPKQGHYTSNAQAIEVVISQTQSRLFSVLFLSSNPVVAARGVVAPTATTGGCVLGLSGTSTTSVQASGNGNVNASTCDLDANGNINAAGNGVVDANQIDIDGTGTTNGNGQLNSTKAAKYNDPTTFSDPYLNRQNSLLPMPSPCTTAFPSSGSVSAPGGTACFKGGTTIGGTVTMGPGIYSIDGVYGGLTVSSNGTLNATGGVTIFLTSSTPNTAATIATFAAAGNAVVNITAPSTGNGAGLAIIQDNRASKSSTGINISGNGTFNVFGAVYAPDSQMQFAGNGSMTSTCLNLIGWEIAFSGNATLQDNCAGSGITPFGPPSFRLSE